MQQDQIQFTDCPIKRKVQSFLLQDLRVNTIIGIAGPNPTDYINLLKLHADNIILCDVNPDYTDKSIRHNSIIGEVGIHPEVDVVDADFCNTLQSNELEFRYIVDKLKTYATATTPRVLLFTFSIRNHDIKREDHVKQLFSILGIECDEIPEVEEVRTFPNLQGNQYIRIHKPIGNLTLVSYRDSENMLSGRYVITSESAAQPVDSTSRKSIVATVISRRKHTTVPVKVEVTDAEGNITIYESISACQRAFPDMKKTFFFNPLETTVYDNKTFRKIRK